MSVEKLPRVITMLKKQPRTSPNKISIEVSSDRRTVHKILQVASLLGIAKYEKLKVGERTYTSWSLTPEYIQLLKNQKG